MKEGQALTEGEDIASDLMKKLGISDKDLVTGAYMDLILKSSWLNNLILINFTHTIMLFCGLHRAIKLMSKINEFQNCDCVI